MKNKPNPDILVPQKVKKIFLTMKISFLLLMLTTLNAYSTSIFSQSAKVSVNTQNATVGEVVGEIENHVLLLINPDNIRQQQITVTGRVTDANTGEGIPGVSIVIEGTTTGVTTDIDGNYEIYVPDKNTVLSFSFVGYQRERIIVGEQTQININLTTDFADLDEVVVVGYGVQRKVNLTGAVTSVNLEKIENRPITNASQALQGVSGLYVNQAGGQPGRDGATLRIRGQGTLGNNNPLVLVDGIEYPLADINPNDIESISVLKDAASAAIYGNRAANGVVLITTKKGQEGVARVEYNTYFGYQSPVYLPDLVKDPVRFMELRDQAQRNAGRATVDYGEGVIEEYRQGMLSDPYTYPANDWLDIMFNNALIQEHNLRISGGRDDISYSLSLGYLDQDGVLMGTSSNKFSLRSNVNYKVNDRVRVGSDFAVTQRSVYEPATTAASMMEMVFKAQGFHPTYLEDGRYADTWVRSPGHNVFRHPLVWAQEGHLNNKDIRGLASVYANVELPFGLSYHAKAGANKLDGFQSRFVPDIFMYQNKTFAPRRVDYHAPNRNRHLSNRDDEDINITAFQTISWDRTFNENHNVTALVGSSYEKFSFRYFRSEIEGFLGNNLYEIDAGSTNPNAWGTSSENILVGGFGRINYNYQEKYLFEANARYDGSSRFAKGNRWGFFPSFSAGWRLEQEEFLNSIDWLQGLKLRASYGSLGNERIGGFRYVNLINTGQDYYFGNSVRPGAAIVSYNDPSITWETTTVTNFGIDASFFQGKLNFIFELYDKRTKDILRPVNLPSQVGNLSGPLMNIGEVSNKGYEFNFGYQNQIGNFGYQLDFAVNYNVNNVENLNDQEIVSAGFSGQTVPTIIKEGYPIDSYFVLESDGIFQTQAEIDGSPFQNITTKPGYLKYVDQNNDGVIDANDRIVIGGAIPDYTYSFSINLSYKNWSVNSFFNGVQGIYTYPMRIVAVPFWFGTSVSENWVNNSWRPDRTDASLPILTTYEESANDIFAYSDFWLLDASYLRLKNLQISYSLPSELIRSIGLTNLVVFVNGQNIFTISKMKDFDPERNILQGSYYEYPSVKTYSAGINVTF